MVQFGMLRLAEIIRLSLDESLVEHENKHEAGAALCHDANTPP